MRGDKEDVSAVLDAIVSAAPDILVLQGIDWDLDGRSLSAFAEALSKAGHVMPHRFARKPNRGVPSGLDLNGNGRLGDAQDAIGFGRFTGQNGLAILSRAPIAQTEAQDFTQLLWADLPDALLPYPGMPEDLPKTLPLSSTAHWLVPIDTQTQGRIWLGTFAATTPVFDGPEDRNGRRNHDEVMFWVHLLDSALPTPAPDGLVIAGNANLDPNRGDGRRSAIIALLSHPDLQDPAPQGDLGLGTVDFGSSSVGVLRVGYILPDETWRVVGAGHVAASGRRHRLIWTDLERRAD